MNNNTGISELRISAVVVLPNIRGHPDVSYRKVSLEEITRDFGEVAAHATGRSWSREMFGHQVIIGEPLQRDGKELKGTFVQAMNACLSLNVPAAKRRQVEAALKAREVALDLIRKGTLPDEEERAELEKIHRTMPIGGVYPASKEELRFLEMDFRHGGKYVPQILPKLNSRWFWSSSGYPYDPGIAFYFGGGNGDVSVDARSIPVGGFRCVAAAVGV